jgi:hypothetical protein
VRHWINLFNLYIFAEKLCLNELANRTIDRIRHIEFCRDNAEVNIALASYVYKKTFVDSPLREYCIAALAFRLSPKDKHIPADKQLKQIWASCQRDSDLFVDYFSYLREHEKGVYTQLPLRETSTIAKWVNAGSTDMLRMRNAIMANLVLISLPGLLRQALKILKTSLSERFHRMGCYCYYGGVCAHCWARNGLGATSREDLNIWYNESNPRAQRLVSASKSTLLWPLRTRRMH